MPAIHHHFDYLVYMSTIKSSNIILINNDAIRQWKSSLSGKCPQ